ncbi:MAG: ammonium transporter [Pseudomonadota bacterium]
MEDQLAELAARLTSVEAKGSVTNTMFAEMYYYLTIPLMVLIHAGFLLYEMGASRTKHALSSGVKNILAFAFVIPSFYFFGWWVYWAFPTGLSLAAGPNGLSGAEFANSIALPWGDSAASMGPNLDDQISGVFWGAFAMFAATTASIMSGAVIERIQTVGFTVLAILLGGFSWTLAAAWGWHADGWLVQNWGFHDFGAAGVVHLVAAAFTLAVLINLGPRIGKFDAAGVPQDLHGHNLPFSASGLMLIIVGFWGFLMACIVVGGEAWSWGANYTTIYGTPTTLGALAFNVLMSSAGGIIGAWVTARDPFWMMSGALAGIIAAASGLDIYWPGLAFVIAFGGGLILKPMASLLERAGIDDAVGAVTVHGVVGFYGLIMLGVFAAGMPALSGDVVPHVTLFGQLLGAVTFVAIGFGTGFVGSLIVKKLGLLRVPEEVERTGLDQIKMQADAYPETKDPIATTP